MDLKVSSKGNVTLPTSIRKQLGIKPGDELTAEVKGEGILISRKARPQSSKRSRPKIETSPVTGLPVLTAGENAPVLTNEMVREMLADFP